MGSPTSATTQTDDPIVSWRKTRLLGQRLLILSPQLILGAAGVAALVVGLHAAWEANAPTTALIIASVLLFLALVLRPDLEELSAWYKEGGVKYRRSVAAASATAYAEVSAALNVALQDEGGDDELRSTIQKLAAQSATTATREAMAAEERLRAERESLAKRIVEFARPSQQPIATTSPLLRAVMARSLATASRVGSDMGLSLLNPPSSTMIATVTRPSGSVERKFTFELGRLGLATGSVITVRYPSEFTGASELEPGQYIVEWSPVTVTGAAEGKPQVAIGEVVARTTFTVEADGDDPPAD